MFRGEKHVADTLKEEALKTHHEHTSTYLTTHKHVCLEQPVEQLSFFLAPARLAGINLEKRRRKICEK